MYLRKQKASDNRYRLRIIKKYTLNGVEKEETFYNIGYVDRNDIQALSTWEFIVDICNEMVEKSEELEERIRSDSELEENRVALNLGTCFIKQILAFFDYRSVFAPFQRKHPIGYQLYQVYFSLVYNTIIDPTSILEASKLQVEFYEDFELELQQFYRALDNIHTLDQQIENREMSVILKYFADTTGIFYIDTTNTFSFCEEDEEGEGLRRYGYGKDGKKLPLVGISLTITHSGFPLNERTYPGNESDSNQLIPHAKKLEEKLEDKRFLIGGDGAFNSGTNDYYLAGRNLPGDLNNGFVFSRSVMTVSEKMRVWLYSSLDWHNGINKTWTLEELEARRDRLSKLGKLDELYKIDYKERIESREIEVKVDNGSRKVKVEQDVMVIACYSDRLRAKKLHTIQKQIERAEKAINNPKKLEKLLQKSSNDYIILNKDAKKDPIAQLNTEKIERDIKTAGYYILETSECSLHPVTVMHLFSDKYYIEWLIRTIKSELHLRPIYLRKPEHISALIRVRFTSLIVVRALQFFLGSGYSTKKIIRSLRNFCCVKEGDEYVIFGRDEIIRELEEFFGLKFKDRMKKSEIDALFAYQSAEGVGPEPFCSFCQDLEDLNLTEVDWKDLKEKADIHKNPVI